MTRDKVKIGILGCGVISETYIQDIQTLYPRLEIAACADVDKRRAAMCAETYGIGTSGDLEMLLGQEEITIIVNLTPPKLHYELNRRILEAGKHLFCEKPFALHLEQALQLARLARENHLRIGGAPDTFLGAGLQRTRELLESGAIGIPLYANMAMMSGAVEAWHPAPAQFYQDGAGPLYDMGPYYLTAATVLFGPIAEISAVRGMGLKKRRIYSQPLAGEEFSVKTPTHYAALLRLTSGVLINLTVSFDVWHSALPLFEIYGTEGTIFAPDPNMASGMPRVTRMEEALAARSVIVAAGRRAGVDFPDEEELTRWYPETKEYTRGAGVMDLALSIREARPNRTGTELLCHIVEALDGIGKAAAEGRTYRMQTSCERPLPLKRGLQAGEIE